MTTMIMEAVVLSTPQAIKGTGHFLPAVPPSRLQLNLIRRAATERTTPMESVPIVQMVILALTVILFALINVRLVPLLEFVRYVTLVSRAPTVILVTSDTRETTVNLSVIAIASRATPQAFAVSAFQAMTATYASRLHHHQRPSPVINPAHHQVAVPAIHQARHQVDSPPLHQVYHLLYCQVVVQVISQVDHQVDFPPMYQAHHLQYFQVAVPVFNHQASHLSRRQVSHLLHHQASHHQNPPYLLLKNIAKIGYRNQC